MKQPTPEIENFLKKPSTRIFLSIISLLILSLIALFYRHIISEIKQVDSKVDKVDTSLNDFRKENKTDFEKLRKEIKENLEISQKINK
ncbi:MAG: hypothetical protein ACQKHC_00660 [Candidatus Phytoplasma pruni]